MDWSPLTEALLELISPTRCAGCGRSGGVFCDWCIEATYEYRSTHPCPCCGAPYGELVCTECEDEEFAFDRTICLGELDEPLSRAVVIYKDAFEIRLGKVLGDLLAQQCAFQLAGKNVTIDVVTWIPPTKRAIQRRGYDHAGILAQRVALQLGAPSCQFLARRNMRDLRSLSRSQRLKEAQDSYRWSHEQERKGSYQEHPDFSGKSILIVDDVLTTGATLNGAAQMFLDAGATSVIGAVLARAW